MRLAFVVILASTVATGCEFGNSTCFTAGTLIWTPGGDIPIEDVAVGDAVFSYNHVTGRVVRGVVTKTWVHRNREFSFLYLPNGQTLGVTKNHPVFAVERNRYAEAASLDRDDLVLLRDDSGSTGRCGKLAISTARLERGLQQGGAGDVYNLSVAGFENYFAQGMLVHNKSVSVDASTPGDASEPPCDPVSQTGCAIPYRCTQIVESAEPLLVRTLCVPDGSVGLGDACVVGALTATGFDDCAAGGYCLDGLCTEICAEDPDSCVGAQLCLPSPNVFDGGIGLCRSACDVLVQNCPNGLACYLSLTSGKSGCAPALSELPSGPGKQADPCQRPNACAPGFGCTLENDVANPAWNICAKFCDPMNLGGRTCGGEPDALPDLSCVPINGFYGTVAEVPTTIGFCIDCTAFSELEVCM